MTLPDAPAPRSTLPLGATPTTGGADFSVYSGTAELVELCLFDSHDVETRVALERSEGAIWRGSVEGVTPGTAYGFRAHGRHDPARALWFDPERLLLDPYARAITTVPIQGQHGFLCSLVVDDDAFDWGSDDAARPRHDWADTVVYEVHVKGATMRHPGVPEPLRGTYAGFASDAMVAHLVDLGVTAVELLPVHEFVDEPFLAAGGRSNYWGYNSIGFFAPTSRYSHAARAGRRGGEVAEFKAMVVALHRAGIEVLLDVVYNHTAESDELGPTLCFRGLDAQAYYRHDDQHRLVDTTGCGNSINAASPVALSVVMDSLRHWVTTYHVDGFRFDLAPTLARPDGRFDHAAPFLELCAQDEVLRNAKLIVEPWDVGGDDSYQLGAFPAPFREWNGRFRDTTRDFWRSDDGTLAEFATRFAGSSDLFSQPARSPTSSVNYVTSHDGFTLQDLVSYDAKHNEANGEGNEDGTDDNRSWNCGAEGPTRDASIVTLRDRQARALLATVLLACGVPMLLAGDELGRTQRGNNNAYCQDNETSWIDWSGGDARHAFTRRLLALRRGNRAFRRRRFLSSLTADELGWYAPSGAAMTSADWEDPQARCVAVFLDGRGGEEAHSSDDADEDDFVVLVNGFWEPVEFTLPDVGHDALVVEIDTSEGGRGYARHRRGSGLAVAPRAVVVLRAVDDAATL